MNKQQTTVWSDGRVQTIEHGTVITDDVDTDMGDVRAAHAALPSTVSVEEIGTTLVVTKETGTVHVYNWTR